MRLKRIGLVIFFALALNLEGDRSAAGPGSMGPEVPFPLTAETPFLWGGVKGDWKATIDGKQMVFTFTVKNSNQGIRILNMLLDTECGAPRLEQGFGKAFERAEALCLGPGTSGPTEGE